MKRRDVLALGSGYLAGAMTSGFVAAQSGYPERPIKLIIPFAPGGVSDAIGRPWAEKMKGLLGPVVIENQGGAGGLVGSTAVARANPDGYTLLLGSAGSQILITGGPAADLEPISILAVTALTIAVHPAMPVWNLKGLVDYARENRGKLSYGSAGAGTMTHLTGELFKSLTGIADVVHVPYKGSGQSITDLISGQIPIVTLSVTGQVLELHQSNKIRMLAVTTPIRIVAAPDIPTAVEAGLPGMISQNFFGLFAPAGTPKSIVEQIAQATRMAMAEHEFKQKLIASGFEPRPDSDPAITRRFIQEEGARWRPIIDAIGFKPQ